MMKISFGDSLKIDVGVTHRKRFKSYSDRAGRVYVVMCNEEDKVKVLDNKSELSKTDSTKKICIEIFMAKQEVLTRDNWSMLIDALGDKGKHLHVVGTGRIVKQKPSEQAECMGNGDPGKGQ